MKKGWIWIVLAGMLAGCMGKPLEERAAVLCGYIPEPEQLERSEGYLTEEFYAVLDTLFHLPDETPVLHEWEFWFVAADGSPISRCGCEVLSVAQTDESHATAQIRVQAPDPDYAAEEHQLVMERVDGTWLTDDWDGYKAHAGQYIQIKKKAQNEYE